MRASAASSGAVVAERHQRFEDPDRPRRSRRAPWIAAAALLLAGLLGPVAFSAGATHVGPATAPNPTSDNVTIQATSSLSFVSSTFSVYPGATVHLVVIQESSFAHTFTLSSVANTTITSLSFFHTHPPLVNLSLGTQAGKSFYANFTAPAVGTYEFVCIYHFSSNMKGTMTSTKGTNGTGGGGGTSYGSSAMPIPAIDWAIAGGAALVIGVAAAVGLSLRKRRREEEMLRPNSSRRRER